MDCQVSGSDDDEFFGNESDDDRMAEHDVKAAERQLQNVAFLDAFDEHKESRLQAGFETGYREVFDIASRLGQTLGQVSARAKIQSILDPDKHNNPAIVAANTISGRFRVVLSDINQGKISNGDAKNKLLELEVETSHILSQFG